MDADRTNKGRFLEIGFRSADGRWIYYDLRGHGIHKIPAEGGRAVSLGIANGLGWRPFASADDKFIYAIESSPNGVRLKRCPVDGGEAEEIVDSVTGWDAWTVQGNEVYYIPKPDLGKGYSVQLLDLATRRVKTIAELGKQLAVQLTVSPDRRWILYTQRDQSGSDLVLVENFR